LLCLPTQATRADADFVLGQFPNAITAVAFSDDGKFLVAGSDGGYALICNIEAKLSCYSIKAGSPVTCAAFSPNNKVFWIGWGTCVHRYLLATREALGSEIDVADWVSSLGISQDGELLAIATTKGTLMCTKLPAASGGGIFRKGPRESVAALSWEPNGIHFLTMNERGIWRRWRVEEKTHFVRPAKGDLKALDDLGAGPVGLTADRQLMAKLNEKTADVTLCDFKTARPLDPPARFSVPKDTTAKCVGLSSDGRTLAIGAGDGRIYCFDLSAARRGSGLATAEGANPMLGPRSKAKWPEWSSGLKSMTYNGSEREEVAIYMTCTAKEPVRAAIRKIENGKITSIGRDGTYDDQEGEDKNPEWIGCQPGKYVVIWRKLLEPHILHESKPFEVFWQTRKRDDGSVVAEYRTPSVTLDGEDVQVKYVKRKDAP
jgi:WD40 repeat protein